MPPELLSYVENFVKENIARNNVAIIGRRNAGKTTTLTRLALELVEKNFVVVVDSATQHVEKSLIKKLARAHEGSHLIELNAPEKFSSNLEPKSKLLLCDVSHFLELSFEQNLSREKNFYLNVYRRLLEKFFAALNELPPPFFLLLDEIDFDEKILQQVQRLNSRGNFFVSAVHDAASLHEMTGVKILNLDRARLDLNLNLPKESKILCGNCCVEVAASIFYNRHCRIPKPLVCCAELSGALESVGISTKVFYHDNQSPSELVAELAENFCGIYSVDSKIFNGAESLNDEHFVLAYIDKERKIILLNPQKNIVSVLRDYPTEKFWRACNSNFGGRVLLSKPAQSS